MKLHTLEVEDFRGIRRATVTFGPGLTVLHGPNELGKSTLVEAIHAALFTPSTSTVGNEHVQWGSNRPASVALTFEHQDRLWRVTKRFGPKQSAKLEKSESVERPHFHEELTGKGVDGRIRDLLAWGIAPPGGKGAPKTPNSFLLTALVGRQGEVQRVFEASLDADSDDAGRSLVNQSLGALDKDPLVATLIEKLTARVDVFFTSTGRLSGSAESPLVQLQNYLRTQQALLDALEADAAKGERIQADVVRLQDARERLVDDLREAKAASAAAEARRVQAEQRAVLQRTVNDLRERLASADALRAQVADLEAQLAACDAALTTLRAEERAAAEQVEQTRLQVQSAAEAVARAQEALQQSATVQQSAADKRRVERELAKVAVEARLADVGLAEAAAAEAQQQVAALAEAVQQRDARALDETRAERTLERATLQRKLAELVARQRDVDAAAAALAEAMGLEEAAQARLQAATQALRDAEAHRATVDAQPASDAMRAAQNELTLLAAAEAQVAIDAVRAEVQALEALDAQAHDTRAAAKARRDEAAALEARVARRTLPTPEQMASWRALEAEVQADSLVGVDLEVRTTSVLPAALAFVGAFVVSVAGAMFGVSQPLPVALGVGLVLGALAGLGVWASQRGRSSEQATATEQRARRRDRFAQEVQPSLRAAGLVTLADYESAVESVAQQKRDAERARAEAAVLDDEAVVIERQAAGLESRRAEVDRLERAKPVADGAAVAAVLASHGPSVESLRRRGSAVQVAIEAERQRLRGEADAVVQRAEAARVEAQAAHDACAKQVAAAEATLKLTRQHFDEAEVARVESRLADLGPATDPDVSVDAATTALDDARRAHTAAATQVQGLEASVAQAQERASARASALGDAVDAVRAKAEQDLAAITAELNVAQPRSLFDEAAMATTALDEATARHGALETQRAAAQAAHAAAVERVKAKEQERSAAETSIASVRGQLSGFDVAALSARLDAALNDPAYVAATDDDQPDADAAAARVTAVQTALEQCNSDLSHAKGQLELTAGHVGSERLAQQQEAVALADAEVKACERTERGALRLLRDLEKAESERATHLGRVLADPVSQAFKALTGERYGRVSLGPDLKTESIEARGETRSIERMSLGAREQLATLMRLAIAGYLRTALVLDDQLVHSDSGRLAWFNDKLRESVREHAHQVIVFTCRRADYLRAESESGVTEVDLTTVVSYPPPP